MIIDEEDYLLHYGVLRKSGRYPWGSGADEHTRNKDFLGYISDMKSKGLSDVEICRALSTEDHPFTTTQLRAAKTIAINQQRQARINQAQRLKDTGMHNVAIGQEMGLNESSVRALLAPGQKDKADVLQTTARMLKAQADEKGAIDIGIGVERQPNIGIKETQFKAAVAMVIEEGGYKVHKVKAPQLGTGKMTTHKVLARDDVNWIDLVRDPSKIRQITEYSEDGGRTMFGLVPPLSVSSKRIAVKYADEGGAHADGVIYVRPGAKDLSMGGNQYAQVRIMVDGTHYLKGMAVLKPDLPPGIDLMFNTNKHNTGNKLDAMKEVKRTKEGEVDPDNPFGSVVRQIKAHDKDGNEYATSAMNLVNEMGDWDKWSNTLSSQMLSKQNVSLAKNQLDMTYSQSKNELDGILKLTNPAVRKKLLETYADSTDSSAVHLEAAGLPRQSHHVILPISSLKENEIYAPNFENGQRVVLIRYPHGGIFEIPELVVNNEHPPAKRMLGQAKDAVGIHHKVAERLSGADFDGDTVLVIRNDSNKVKTAPALEKLKGFDPKASYPEYPGMVRMTSRDTQVEMGKISNLITDMTIQGANHTDLARAVRHSMVVIDAEKHGLDYKQSAIDNGINQLKTKYQGGANKGASTLISRAGSTLYVKERKQGYRIDPATGKKIYIETGDSFVDKNGKLVVKTTKTTKLAEADDAHALSSGTPIEKVYADHSNKLKALANTARKEYVATKTIPYSKSAKAVYSKEVAALDAKLDLALRNAPLERRAQVVAHATVAQKRRDNPDMKPAELKKIKAQALFEARIRSGAKPHPIKLEDREWEAIQAGAISNNKLTKILNHADLKQIKELATPREALVMTSTKKSMARSLAAQGYTQAEIAAHLGMSVSTLKSSGVLDG